MRATVSAALPAVSGLMVSTERFGQSCARAAGASVMTMAQAAAAHAVRNDIASSLDYRSSKRFVDYVAARGRIFASGRRSAPLEHDAPDQPAQAMRRAPYARASHTLAGA